MSKGFSFKLSITKSLLVPIVLIFVLVLTFFGLERLGKHYAEEVITSLVERETKGLYHLDFDRLGINLFTSTISVKGFKLGVDPTQNVDSLALNNIYTLHLAELAIHLESVSAIYLKKELIIKNVKVVDPIIEIAETSNAKKSNFSIRTGNLYNAISDYLKVFEVDDLKVKNAAVNHTPSQFSLGSIDFFVRNFLINSTSNPDSSFYSGGIKLEINDQDFAIGDSIHKMHFDRFLMSTTDSVLRFENFSVLPRQDYLEANPDSCHTLLYNITVPWLELKGVDFFSAYSDNRLDMEEIFVADALISVVNQESGQSGRDKNEKNPLLRELFNVFEAIQANQLKFANTQLDINGNQNMSKLYQQVKAKRLDMVLYGLKLDSSNYQMNSRNLFFEDIELSIHAYASVPPDSTHYIAFGSMKASTLDSSLVFDDLRFSNNSTPTDQASLFSANIPSLALQGIHFRPLLNKQLLFSNLVLSQPKINIEKVVRHDSVPQFSVADFYGLIKPYFEVIYLKNFSLDDMAISVEQDLSIEGLSISLDKFYFDQQVLYWHEISSQTQIAIRNIRYNGEQVGFSGEAIKMYSSLSKWDLENGTFQYTGGKGAAAGSFKQLMLTGVSMDSLLSGKNLWYDSVTIIQPDISAQLYEANAPNNDSVQHLPQRYQYINIVDGKFALTGPDSSTVHANEVNAIANIGPENYLQQGQLADLSIHMARTGQSIHAQQVTLTDEAVLTIDTLATHTQNLDAGGLNAEAPQVVLYGWTQSALYDSSLIQADSLVFSSPQIEVAIKPNPADTARQEKPGMALQLGTIRVHNARLAMTSGLQGAKQSLKGNSLDLTLVGFDYPAHALIGENSLLFAQAATLSADDIVHSIQNQHVLRIDQFDFSSAGDVFEADTIFFAHTSAGHQLTLPKARLTGFDLYGFVHKNQLKLDTLLLSSPQITASLQNKQNSAASLPYEALQIGYLSSTQARLLMQDASGKKQHELPNFSLTLTQLAKQGRLKFRNILKHTGSLNLTGDNLVLPISGYYNFRIGQYDLQHPTNSLSLKNIGLSGSQTPEAYSRSLVYQDDWFGVSARQLDFQGLDLARLFSEEQLKARKITTDGLQVLVYRDKSVPFRVTQRRELPQTMLRNANAWVYIDTLQARGEVTYQEKPPKGGVAGEISFGQLDASLFYVTTVAELMNRPMILEAKGQLMHSAPFKARAMFDTHSPDNQFSLAGEVKALDLTLLNRMIKPLANVNIKSGYSKRLIFNMGANNDFAKGTMKFYYNNLKIQLLEEAQNDYKVKGVKTMFANTFVVNKNNPSFLLVREGKVFAKRDASRAIFNYWAKALLSGAISSIGIKKVEKNEKEYFKANEVAR